MKFHHEFKADLKKQFEKALKEFESKKAEYNLLYDIASDYISIYPGEYHYLGENYLSLGIPNDMSIEQFNAYIDYIEIEYLENYELNRNDQFGNDIRFMYINKETKNILNLQFYNPNCKRIKTGKLIEETITKCTWGE